MAKTFHLTIAKVGENLFEGEALSVTLPGTDGMFTVMAGHEAFVSPLKEGIALVKDASGSELPLPIEAGGIAEVSSGQATVLL
ncbi:F0F1 ATP synthase subunit epsilon [Patescibacteria group bacterium]|nr:F0F1 ATP synthase subunit epsilon [Patescibacteria group bacterium]MBU2159068.1 F0F1 ATP synthase subunit epsilon [Patescibacteria group bacterium]MBU2220692.1 F0F1 ATP synthase subunit epsilon [Patescibacteria group bacterium]